MTLSFDLARGVAIGQAVAEVQALADSTLPISIITSFQGSAQAFQESFRGLGILLIMAVLVIYLVLGILYESFIHPITILTGLPAAAFGGLLTLSALSHAARYLRFCRLDHADRHHQEERDHDGGFRPGTGAHRRLHG